MSTPDQTPAVGKYDAITKRAADFFQRRRFWNWTDKDQVEFDAWLAESCLHRAAYLRIEGIAAHTEELVGLRSSKPDRFAEILRTGWRHKLLVPLLVAASLALVTAYGIPFLESLIEPPIHGFSTDIGGRTLLKFADGTEFELNTDTAVRFRITNHERMVWLDRGEVWFHVAHDPDDPFAVIVGNHRISDLGTEFDVHRGPAAMEVTLLNGRASLSTQSAQTAMLTPGDDAIATSAWVSVSRKNPRELADKLAWRRGMFVFRDTKLADVAREFNRYNATKLVIADPSIADLKVTTEIKTDHFEQFLQFAEAVWNLRADREGDVIRISRRPQEEKSDETKRAAPSERGP
jgi:transmembrane sensor